MSELPGGPLAVIITFVLLAASVLVYSRVVRRVLSGGGTVDVSRFGAVEFGFSVGLIALYGMMLSGAWTRSEEVEVTMDALLAGGVVQVSLCALLLVVLLWRGHRFTDALGTGSASYHRIAAWSALLLAAFYPLVDVAMRTQMAIQGTRPEQQPIVEFARGIHSPAEQMAMVLFAVIIAPLTEEFIFRGFLYRSLKARLGLFTAALLTSLLFSVIHLHGPSFLPLAMFGFVLVMAYERTGSLLAPMLMHTVFNAASLVAMRVAPDQMP